MKPPGSLRRRLLAAAALWIGIGLVAVGVLLVALFRQHVEAEAADRAGDALDALVAALTPAPALPGAATASLSLAREPAEPRFAQPLGGRYWWVQGEAGTLLRSRSWWDQLPSPQLTPPHLARQPGQTARHTGPGPAGQTLMLWARRVELAGLDAPVLVAVAVDMARQAELTRQFARTVALALCLLALVLWAAAALQVRTGLVPLGALQAVLRQLRAGQARQVAGAWPAEVQPLVDELNGVLDDNQRLVQQAREQTGNLAHGLKTPLAVIGNAARAWPGEDGVLVRQQLAQLQRQVDLHLARARSAALARRASGAQGLVLQPLVQDLLRTLGRLHAERSLQLTCDLPADLPPWPVDSDTLHEMLGNLLDNACKWARSRVEVQARAVPGGLQIEVHDDGPGIPEAQRSRALQRGQRLDEAPAGSGLGLTIVGELAAVAGAGFELGDSPLGGLRARLFWPVAAA